MPQPTNRGEEQGKTNERSRGRVLVTFGQELAGTP